MEAKENCPVEATLELIGGKYKALILWHLSDSKLRFSELRSRITKATPKMLTQQLRELETSNLVHREVYPVYRTGFTQKAAFGLFDAVVNILDCALNCMN